MGEQTQPFWVDESGIRRKVPANRQRMSFGKYPLHAALRAFVFRRDQFTCQGCGRRVSNPPDTYDGRFALKSDDGIVLCLDHIRCLRRNGTNHPTNLQVLCWGCNARKVTTHDKQDRKAEVVLNV